MALTKHGIKDQKLVSFGGRPNREEEEKREKKRRRRGRGREEEEKRRGKLSQKGMELCIDCMELLNLVWILVFVWLMACPKPRVC